MARSKVSLELTNADGFVGAAGTGDFSAAQNVLVDAVHRGLLDSLAAIRALTVMLETEIQAFWVKDLVAKLA